jgi:hypothetical protein
MTEAEFCWDRVKHEESLFTSRANFFLVGESMLLVGVATLLTAHHPPHNAIQVFCWVGLLSTGFWCLVNWLQRRLSWGPSRERLKALGEREQAPWNEGADNGLAPSYARIRARAAARTFGWVRSHVVMGYGIPVALLVAWVVLLLDLPAATRQDAEAVVTFDRVLLVILAALFAAVLYWLVRRLNAVETQLALLRNAGAANASAPGMKVTP